MKNTPPFRRPGRGRLPGLALAVLAAGASAHADFQPSEAPSRLAFLQDTDNPFSALVGGKPRKRAFEDRVEHGVERYVLTSDNRAFLFEEQGRAARVQFLCTPEDTRIDCVLDASGPSPEIYQLSATRGPRGDVIYKNGEGETLLRIAAYGGATVFWPGERQGIAASKSFGDDSPLKLAATDYDTVMRRAQSASAQISAIVGAPVVFDVGAGRRARSPDAAVLADAVLTAAKGIAGVADDPIGARIIADRISRVAFLPGAAPGVAVNGAVLEILYVPNKDINGRPSSAKIAHYLEETL